MLNSRYIGGGKISSINSAISDAVSIEKNFNRKNSLPNIPGWVDTISTGLDHGFSMINSIRSSIACLQFTDLWDLMRLDGVTELPGTLSKVATVVGWGLSIAGGVISGYEKYASGASISSSIAGGLINTGISIGGMYVSTAVASSIMGGGGIFTFNSRRCNCCWRSCYCDWCWNRYKSFSKQTYYWW